MSLKERLNRNKEIEISNLYKSYLQSYLRWLFIQNPSFSLNLTTEEITNYFLHGIELPDSLNRFLDKNSFEVLSKTYEYISHYQDKTEMFSVKYMIQAIEKGNYKEVTHD